MHTIAAFSESQDPAGVFVNMAGVPDQEIRVVGDQIFIPSYDILFGAAAYMGTTAAQVRLVAPSIRRYNPQHIVPVDLALYPDGYPHIAVDPKQVIQLEKDEGLECEENSNPALAEQHTVIIFLADSKITPVDGKIITVRFTITLALLAGEWAYSEIAFIDELPVGNYKIVGGRFEIDTAVAARFVPKGAGNRPGCPCVSNVEFPGDKVFRRGGLGVWTEFHTNRPPAVEVISSAAAGSSTYQGYMDLLVS